MYRLNMDNRILNNLRNQLNEMIKDNQGLVSIQVFRRAFFTYFKAERNAQQIYDMLQPAVTVYYSETDKKFLSEDDPDATEATKFARI